ncbi:MAG: hypothetical protein FWH27_15025 [Planctomycetaceae bacterium]|nr:hypothetical protein [Planctomycetaceae bacterium]
MRYIAIVAVFLHCLLCGNVSCCAVTCSDKDDAALVTHHPLFSACLCHSEKHDLAADDESTGCHDFDHHCGHQHHFCQCVQSIHPNSGTTFRVALTHNLFSLPVTPFTITSLSPSLESGFRVSETMRELSALGVRLHLLLEHLLI